MRATLSIILLPWEYLLDWVHALRWGKGAPFRRSRKAVDYDIVLLAHTIEKGLSLPDVRAKFGEAKIRRLLHLCTHADGVNGSRFPLEMASGALHAYLKWHHDRNLDLGDVGSEVEEFLTRCGELGVTANGGVKQVSRCAAADFGKVLAGRSSCRRYTSEVLSEDVIKKVVTIAQSAPSQCNRQSVRVHFYSDYEQIQKLLTLQGGTAGFREHVRNLFVITSERVAWSGVNARNQGYVDGGLFSMQLGLACMAEGIGNCMLNLAVGNSKEARIRRAGNIGDGERLIMMMALGYPAEDPVVCAKSARVPIDEVVTVHS